MDVFGRAPRHGRVPTVLFNGALGDGPDVAPAVEFFCDVMSAIRHRVPDARFVVSHAEGRSVARLLARPGVELVGPTSDLHTIGHSHTVVVAPLRAGDPRSTVLEPMASGLPVVTTKPMCRQIGARPGRDLQVAEGPGEFSSRVAELLESPGLRGEMGARAREFVAATFSWEIFAARLGEVLVKVGSGAAPVSPQSAPRPLEATFGG